MLILNMVEWVFALQNHFTEQVCFLMKRKEINGRKVVPFDVILKHTPAAPKDPEVIKRNY